MCDLLRWGSEIGDEIADESETFGTAQAIIQFHRILS